jgi:hypothetical protein
MNERNLNEGRWEDRKQWSLGVGQRRKTFWNRYMYIPYILYKENKEEDVGSYWMTLRKGEDSLIWKRKLWIPTMWRARFGRGFGPVVRQTTKWMNDSHLKEEALDRTMWRARFGRGFGPVVRQTAKWMNDTV